MRIYHYAIIFAIIAIVFVTIRDISYAQVDTVNDVKKDYNQCFTRAVDAAVNQLVVDENGCIFSSRDVAYTTLLNSLYTALDLNLDTEGKERLKLYLPVVAIADEDGLYLCYYKDMLDNKKHLERIWSERIPYEAEYNGTQYQFTLSGKAVYLDEDANKIVENELPEEIEALRIDTISRVIEQTVMEYVNLHNKIAGQYGIQYEFHVSLMDNSINQRAITNPSLLVMFQGYPLLGKDKVFECFAFAGASVRKHNYYLVTKEDWYYVYHREDCKALKEELDKNPEIEEILCNSKKECAKYGAFPCPDCMDRTGDYSYLSKQWEQTNK